MYPLVHELAADGIPVTVTCRVLDLARQPYYRWLASPGKVGAAGDYAAMESFFAVLQKNVLDCRSWATRQELRLAIVSWIERTYHRRRRQAALGRLSPTEYNTIMIKPAAQAA